MLRGPCEPIMYSLALGGAQARAHKHTYPYIHIKYVFYAVNVIAGLRFRHYSLPKPEGQFADLCFV